MNTVRSSERKICVWRSGEKKFAVPLDFMVGMGTLKITLQPNQNEIAGSDIAGININVFSLKIVQDFSNLGQATALTKLLVLQANEYWVATKIDELLFYGDEKKWPQKESESVFWVTERHITQSGVKNEPQQTAVVETEQHSSHPAKNFIFFKLAQCNYAIDINDVVEVISPRQAVEFRLVSEKALGYFHAADGTLPIISIGAADFNCEKIIISKHNNLKFGFPVNAITNLIRDFETSDSADSSKSILYNGEQWAIFNVAASLKNIKLDEITVGYENVFSMGQRLNEAKTESVLKSLVLMDIGEKVCINAKLIRKVEPLGAGFNALAETFAFDNMALPLIDARKHYGLTKNANMVSIERILILEKEDLMVAVLVSSVDAIVYIDEKSISAYGEWIFRESNVNFKKDVAGMIHVLDYQHKGEMNLVNISFDTIFDKVKKAS